MSGSDWMQQSAEEQVNGSEAVDVKALLDDYMEFCAVVNGHAGMKEKRVGRMPTFAEWLMWVEAQKQTQALAWIMRHLHGVDSSLHKMSHESGQQLEIYDRYTHGD